MTQINKQLELWLRGVSVHDYVEDSCVPDMSCCRPELKQPKEIRALFCAGGPEVQGRLYLVFLEAAIMPLEAEGNIKGWNIGGRAN